MGTSSHCLVTEEISHLTRSSPTIITNLLANISGLVACSLACKCRVEFYNIDAEKEIRSKTSSFDIDGCKLICDYCDQGKNFVHF